jgi:hypothetical protein
LQQNVQILSPIVCSEALRAQPLTVEELLLPTPTINRPILETAVQTAELRPSVKATLINNPEKGEVTLERASINGALVKVSGESSYRRIEEIDEKAQKSVKAQADEKRRLAAMYDPPRPFRGQPIRT